MVKELPIIREIFKGDHNAGGGGGGGEETETKTNKSPFQGRLIGNFIALIHPTQWTIVQ